MIIKHSAMTKEDREKMRGGEGVVSFTHLAEGENLHGTRLLSHITIPVGASIGEHQHLNETEYYIITAGKGIVCDSGKELEVEAGDLVITGDGHSHSIKNHGYSDLHLFAVIITH